MGVRKQVRLKYGRAPVQVPYPADFKGERSNPDNDDNEVHISSVARYLSLDEIALVEAYVQKLPYAQQLVYTGATLVGEDPLLSPDTTHDELDKIESTHGMPSSRTVPGGERDLRSRVLIIRERGFLGNGRQVLAAGK